MLMWTSHKIVIIRSYNFLLLITCGCYFASDAVSLSQLPAEY